MVDSVPSNAERPSQFTAVDFNQCPFTVAWEITRSCALACVHCRAQAQPRRHAQELATAEGMALIDQLAEMGNPILVITGGDPLMRRDVFDFIRHATDRGLRVSFSPSATALLTPANLRRAHEAGAVRVHLSLDGSTPEIHDAFRGFAGSHQRTVNGLRAAREEGLSLQVGSTVTRRNLHDLPALASLVESFGALMWSVFFLVPTGRGQREDMISPPESEETLNWLYDLSRQVGFDVRTTAAQHYRRVVIQRRRAEVANAADAVTLAVAGAGYSFQDGLGRPQQGVNDGKGFCFISHVGDVCPSGFLEIPGGNLREQPVAEIYRDSALFRALRDPSRLKGKCGRCEFREVCGGSRARAYALTGDYLESDPTCIYEPEGTP